MMLSKIKELAEQKRAIFKSNYKEMVADYNREIKTIKEYHGRQLLELIQNCDDQGSDEVFVNLDTTRKTISISNNGEPFSEMGYESLFISDLSSKTQLRKYIGNKGLGFRSILNWANEVEIISNGFSVHFSVENKRKAWEELFTEEIRHTILLERGLDEQTIPIPFLAVPSEPCVVSNQKYVTTINITYKNEFEKNILKQLSEITPETILFLKHITNIKFEGIEKEDISCKKRDVVKEGEYGYNQVIETEFQEWHIFSEEKILPKEYADSDKKGDEYYQIKIAVDKDFKKSSSQLYSFFPTNILLNQPYILHATFDLDSSRNQIVDSKKNEFLLNEVADFTLKVANYYKEKEISYRPLRIIFHKHKADSLNKSEFKYYEKLEGFLKDEHLFPIVGLERYGLKDQVCYNSNDFAQMLASCNATEIIPEHLIPLKEIENHESFLKLFNIQKVKYLYNFNNKLDKLGKSDLSTSQRLFFIKIIEDEFLTSDFKSKISLLINSSGDVINGDSECYTPPTNDSEISIPSFADIDFINNDLFEKLLALFEFDKSTEKDKGRFISRTLSGYCTIHPFEPMPLIEKIISETKAHRYEDGFVEKIQEMNQCLFTNYLQLSNSTKRAKISIKEIPAINLAYEKSITSNLTFSVDYSLGKNANMIFGELLANNKLLGTLEQLGLQNHEEIEDFLSWLGVNEFLPVYRTNYHNIASSYVTALCKEKNVRNENPEYNITIIDNFIPIVANLKIHQFLFWIIKDSILYKLLDNKTQSDSVRVKALTFNGMKSFTKFLIEIYTKLDFKDFLIDDNLLWINEFKIDYNDPIFIINEIKKDEIVRVLMLLGAKLEFNELSHQKLYKILRKLNKEFPNGDNSQTIYRKMVGHYRANQKPLDYSVDLFADAGDGLKIFPRQNIYFSNRIRIPKKLKKYFPILNFTNRSGGSEALKFFMVKNLEMIEFKIVDRKDNIELTELFQKQLEQLKPYILAIRLQNIESNDTRAVIVNSLNKLRITLCDKVDYQIKEDLIEMDTYEYIIDSEEYLIRINSYDTIQSLRKINSFSEKIAEILCNTFDISTEKNDFKNLFRGNVNTAVQNSIDDNGLDIINEAKLLIGQANLKYSFWESIFRLKSIPFPTLTTDATIENLLLENFDIEFDLNSIDYDNLSAPYNIASIEKLFNQLSILVLEFNNSSFQQLDYSSFHRSNLLMCYQKQREFINSYFWHSLLNKDLEEKGTFLDSLYLFETNKTGLESIATNFSYRFNIHENELVTNYLDVCFPGYRLTPKNNYKVYFEINNKAFTAEQIEMIEDNKRLKSLMYFDGTSELIKNEISNKNESAKLSSEHYECTIDMNFVTMSDGGELTNIPHFGIPQKTSFSKSYNPSLLEMRNRKRKGNKCEEVAFKKALEIDAGASWVSRFDEGLHYDIQYTDTDGKLKYVEVKAFDNGKFYLSVYEYEFGKSNKANYEIWLVSGFNHIYKIVDFFDDEAKYICHPNEYIVFLEKKKENAITN